jgi:hypothetical protein
LNGSTAELHEMRLLSCFLFGLVRRAKTLLFVPGPGLPMSCRCCKFLVVSYQSDVVHLESFVDGGACRRLEKLPLYQSPYTRCETA